MSEIKLVLSDMDDTLAPHMKHEISDAVRQAVIDVESRGVKVAVVTGRAYVHAKSALTILGIEGPSVFDGGATIVDTVSGEIIDRKWIEIEDTKEVVEILKKYCSEAYFDHTSGMRKLHGVDVEAIQEEAPSIFAIADNEDLINKVAKELATVEGVKFFTGMGTHPQTEDPWPAIHITHVYADKFHGVEALRRIVGVDKQYTLAIGDGSNDIPLFENAQVKVAIGNATDQLKAAADHIVGTLEDDGFAEAMHKYVL